jgi:hypothetical protein
VLTQAELAELRSCIELIADGLDKDSLSCQGSLDELNKATEDVDVSDEPSDMSSPMSRPSNEYLSRKDHIEE